MSATIKVKVNEVYKCGEVFVRILSEVKDSLHPTGFYSFVGIECYRDGSTSTCAVGMFGECGGFYMRNTEDLQHELEPVLSEEEQRKLEERKEKLDRITKIELELAQLKQEL